MGELTKAQLALLKRLGVGPSYEFRRSTGRDLVKAGLAARSGDGTCIWISDLGRAALLALDQAQ